MTSVSGFMVQVPQVNFEPFLVGVLSTVKSHRSDQPESGPGPGLPSGGARRRASDRSDSRRSGAGRDRNATGFPALLSLTIYMDALQVLRANVIHGLWDPKTKLAIHCLDPSGGVD